MVAAVEMLRCLQESPCGERRVDWLAERLGGHPRTVRRYVAALREGLPGEDGDPLV